jgi:hypothetical protein
MKLLLAGAAVLATRLALASIVVAQIADIDRAAPAPPRVELGPTGGLTLIFPEFGGMGSVPLDRRSAVEVLASRWPASWDAPSHSLVQVQLRTAFREALRSRKSLVLGLTRIAALRTDDGFFGTDSPTFVRPHAGVSLQWPVASTVDFRFDTQGIFTLDGEFPLIPRAVTAFVWHPRARP